ncbi:hypothetical protein [Ramlibacter montanisoli]|uniref:hypothetical protein n=1 Tax=Ramlibacter montanisoli TaxID=2732512 RepID=UPI00209C5AE3|nr:hypothetical protein [Ramlibacter montanisoli]
MNRRSMNALMASAALAFAAIPAAASAATWPDGKPISIVVPYAPGGTADALRASSPSTWVRS